MNLKERTQLTADLKAFAKQIDIDVFGIGGLDEMNEKAPIGRRPKDLIPTAKAMVSLASGFLDPWIKIWYSPTTKLEGSSSTAFAVLQIRAFKLRKFLRERGYKLYMWNDMSGPFRLGMREAEAFRVSGLGYVGRNYLAISPKYGARMLIGNLLTDAPLVPDEPYKEDLCEDCKICTQYCASEAIIGDGYYNARQCETLINCLPNKVYISTTGWYECDMCYRKCPIGEHKWPAEDRRGTWWNILKRNREALISQKSAYRKLMDSDTDWAEWRA